MHNSAERREKLDNRQEGRYFETSKRNSFKIG